MASLPISNSCGKSFVTSLGARRHPWVWILFHRSLAGEFRQVCIPDQMAKVMTDIPVWDTLDIYFSAMSDLAAPVSSRAWTCFPAISSYIQNAIYRLYPHYSLCLRAVATLVSMTSWKVIQTFFDEDLFNLGHCNLITLTIKLNGCWPIKLRAYCTPLWIRKVVNDMIKAGVI